MKRRTARVSSIVCCALLTLVCSTACTGGSTSASQRLRDHVASELHVMLNRHGVPITDGVLSCEGPAADGSIDCVADTAYEPQQEVKGTFTFDAAVPLSDPLPPSCPGNLAVRVGSAHLAAAHEDPCG